MDLQHYPTGTYNRFDASIKLNLRMKRIRNRSPTKIEGY